MRRIEEVRYEDLINGASSRSTQGPLQDPEMENTNYTSQNGNFSFDRLTVARMVLAEMFGTFIIVFSLCGTIACTEMSRGSVGLLEYAVTGSLAIMVVVFSIGHISGAHVNPAVTIGYAAISQFPWSLVPFYLIAQMCGSVLATYIGKILYGMPADFALTEPFHGRMRAFGVELVATLFIMFLASALSFNAHMIGHLSGLAVGAVIGVAVLITGPVSGASLNPARSFGPAIVSWKFENLWIYCFAPTIGAIVGAFLFRLIHVQHRHRSSSLSFNASSTTE